MSAARPDLILFVADEWRGDALGHQGDPAVATPHLDRLAETDALSFSRAFCQNPVCVPSRCSVMTGWYPHVRGHRTQHHLLQADEPNLLRRLRRAGYFVWWAGKNDLMSAEAIEASVDVRRGERPRRHLAPGRRWREWWPDPETPGYYSFYAGRLPAELDADDDRADVDAAVELLANRPADRPLCLVLTLLTPHCPYAAPDPWYGRTDRSLVPDPLPRPEAGDGKPRPITELIRRQRLEDWSADQWRELRATYYDMCTRTDALFGEVVRAVRDSGRYDDTAILMFSDHGDFAGDFGLPEKAQNVFDDSLTRVPLLIKPPRDRAGRTGVTDALTELVDVTATVEDLAGLPRDYDHFGRSLMPLVTGGVTGHRDDVLCEGGRRADEPQAAELASPQRPEGLYYPRMSLQRTDPAAHGKAAMLRTARYKYVRRLDEDDELYDLECDPGERRNLVHTAAAAEPLADLRTRLLDRMITTADVVPYELDHR